MRHHVVRILPYTLEQVFALVGDVEAYPAFVPWITAMRTGPVETLSPGVTRLDAEARVGFAFLKESFATRVTRDANNLAIRVDLISGPFRRLANRWSFSPAPTGCSVAFDIDFEFKSRLLEGLLKANFTFAVDRLIGCFEARARDLYGAPAPTEG